MFHSFTSFRHETIIQTLEELKGSRYNLKSFRFYIFKDLLELASQDMLRNESFCNISWNADILTKASNFRHKESEFKLQ